MKCIRCGEEMMSFFLAEAQAWHCPECDEWEYSAQALDLIDDWEDHVKQYGTYPVIAVD